MIGITYPIKHTYFGLMDESFIRMNVFPKVSVTKNKQFLKECYR